MNTRESLQAKVESIESKDDEIEGLKTIKKVMESKVVQLQEELEITMTQVRLA